MLLLFNSFRVNFYGLSNDLNDMAYLMLKEASFLYLEKILLNDESAITTGIQSEYCIDTENHR